jgi:hypothetical protein
LMPVLCHSDRIQLAGCLGKGLLPGRLLSSPDVRCALGCEQLLIHSELLVRTVLLRKSLLPGTQLTKAR